MDARREAQGMVIPFPSLATPQTLGYEATLRAGADFGALTAGAKEKNIEIKKTVTDSRHGYPL